MTSDADREAFDEYLELALRGAPPTVDEFARTHGLGAEEARALRELEPIALRGASARRALDGSRLPFERLGEFVLRERLGHGGQGLVFLAEQPSLARAVAVKILRPELWSSGQAEQRLEREARALAALRHTHIVAIHAFGSEGDVRFLAMDYLPGPSLEERLRDEQLPLARKVRWCADLARALEHAHRAGVLHRDVKPSNVRFDAEDRPVLLDFGLAKSDSDDASLTHGFAGSPHYAAPEHLSGSGPVDARSDVYSLGVVLYRAACGRLPFDGMHLQAVIARILAGNPLSPRRIDPSIPRDLDSVILRALEPRPERRYASAQEFADDLEAMLDLRPVRARPLSPLERVRRGARRRPGAAAALSTAALALVATAAVLVVRSARERERVHAEARELVQQARERVADYRASKARLESDVAAFEEYRRSLQYRFLEPEEIAALDRSEARVAEGRRAWEAAFYGALGLLSQAERLDGAVAGAVELRGELYAERAREALLERDADAADFYRRLALSQDPGGGLARDLARPAQVTITTEPPGAEVFLFRLEDLRRLQGEGQARFVPVDRARRFAALAGSWALEVVEANGELARGDLVLALEGRPIDRSLFVARAPQPLAFLDRLVAVDGVPADAFGELRSPLAADVAERRVLRFERGGESIEATAASLSEAGLELATAWELAGAADRPALSAEVWRDGRTLAATLPPGARVRPTATPLLCARDDALGATPLRELELEDGMWLALARAPACEEVRWCFRSSPGERLAFHFELDALGSTPAGFVRVDGYGYPRQMLARGVPYWLQEREVTAGEYLRFLDDPATQAEIDAAREPIRYPRSQSTRAKGGYWQRGADGRFRLPPPWRADHPVLGVSWHDAVAYARWASERARERGERFEYALPTIEELGAATGPAPTFLYPWGDTFRPGFARTCYAQLSAAPGPVMQFPIDRSALGAYDLAGGAFEWLDTWYDRARGLRRQAGGSWARSDPEMLKVSSGIGSLPETAGNEEGFRLVARVRAPGPPQDGER